MAGEIRSRQTPATRSRWSRAVGLLRPSHTHSVFSATLLLMASSFLSRIIGLVRMKYIAWLFGTGLQADALTAAFVLPDMISYFLVGGVASISFVSMLTRYKEQGEEARGERSLSVILNTMYLVLGAAIVVAELAAPLWVHWWFKGFGPEKAALCVQLTRILLPAQLFFFAGGVFGSVLLVRKQFNVQAVAPLIYGSGAIVGGVLLYKYIGASSLAIGTTMGAFFGPFLLNWIFAHRAGTRYHLILDWHDEGLHEWIRLTLPLMIGQSLVTWDNWFIAYFASDTNGGIALMNYAKQMFTAPMSMLGQAAGVASMPFFASLWTKGKRYEFAVGVADSVSRLAALGLLISSCMIALGKPTIELFLVGGRFSKADAGLCAVYFTVFCGTMCLWGAQSLYVRAFYAAGKTLEPAVASTVVTMASFPVYAALYHSMGMMGLAIASDLGIVVQTVTVAVLLHNRRMVSLASLDYRELGRCLLAGVVSGSAVAVGALGFERVLPHLHIGLLENPRLSAAVVLVLGSVAWLLMTRWVLELTGSALPRVAMQKLGMGKPRY
ncbi:MAG: lipid II flippase MurJ [Terracidiphilus sp.]|nr:lipid II flippase MurJ [Terracidiphilus sp.]